MHRHGGRGQRWAGVLLGGLLIVAGVALLAAQVYGLELGDYLGNLRWPAFVIIPGVALLAIGLVLEDEPGIGLSVGGSIVTIVGLVLWYQDATDHWSSWAYAWALVAPAGPGIGMTLWGLLHLRAGVLRAGLGALGFGAVLFLVFFGLFEGLLGIGGERGLAPYGRQALPIALILAGALIVISRLWPRRGTRRYGGHDAPPPAEDRPADA